MENIESNKSDIIYNNFLNDCSSVNRYYRSLVSSYNNCIHAYGKIENLNTNSFGLVTKASSRYMSKNYKGEYFDIYDKECKKALEMYKTLKDIHNKLLSIENPTFITYIIRVYINHEKSSKVSKELNLSDSHKKQKAKKYIKDKIGEYRCLGKNNVDDESIDTIEKYINSFTKPIIPSPTGSLSNQKAYFKECAKLYNYYLKRSEELKIKISQDKVNKIANDNIDIGYYLEYQHSLAITNYVGNVYKNVRDYHGPEAAIIIKSHYIDGIKNVDLAKQYEVEYRTIVNWQDEYLKEYL